MRRWVDLDNLLVSINAVFDSKTAKKVCEYLDSYIAVEEEAIWIPVAEKLPKAKEDVLICTKSGWILIGWYGPNGQRWHITPADAGITREDIVAWLPLPESFNPQN